jgi:hypothetical protein
MHSHTHRPSNCLTNHGHSAAHRLLQASASSINGTHLSGKSGWLRQSHIALIVSRRYHPRAMNWNALLFNDETWRFINTFAPWLFAIGTIAAVIVSLYLAFKNRRLNLKVTANLTTIQDEGAVIGTYNSVSAVNLGNREVTITGVGWSLPFKKTKLFQIPGAPKYSTKIPTRLRDGEEADFFMPAKPGQGGDDWIPKVKKYLGWAPRLKVHFLRAHVHTSVGKTFATRLGRHVRDLLMGEEAKK